MSISSSPPKAPPMPAQATERTRLLRLMLPLSLLLLLAAPAPAAAAKGPDSSQPDLNPDQGGLATGTLVAGENDIFRDIRPPAGTNPAIQLTLTTLGSDTGGDVDLYCSKGRNIEPGPDDADFESTNLGTNRDYISIPPLDAVDFDKGDQPVYVCVVHNPGVSLTPVSYQLRLGWEYNQTTLNDQERQVAQQLFDRCCGREVSCQDWKLANEDLQKDTKSTGQQANSSLVDTDLCQFGACEDGSLVQLDLEGFFMSCPFPGDLFAQFTKLQTLLAGWNSFTGDIDDAARSLAALPDLQELGLYDNQLSGSLDEGGPLCKLTQGRLEMLRLGNMGLTGTLPACLFNGNSSLYQVSLAYNQLEGTIPNAFATATRLQLLSLAGNRLAGPMPPTLAALPNLSVLDLGNNSLSGEIPDFASQRLTSLDLSFNKLSGAIPDSLGAHPSLVSFEAKGNQLTSLPAAWQRAPGSAPVTAPLSYVRLSSNPSLGGGFPVGLANYPNLTLLLLSENRLGGPLPNPSAGQFPKLRFLDLDDNQFSGTIGEGWNNTGIFQLPPLGNAQAYFNTFSVMDNQLEGPLPPFLTDDTQEQVNVFLTGNKNLPDLSPGTSSSSSSGSSGGSGLSGGAIAGICVGAVLGVVALAVVGVWAVKRHRQQRAPQTGVSGKFNRFMDEAPTANQSLPHFEPAAFYEAAAAPGPSGYTPPTIPANLPLGGVELTPSPAPQGGV
ncbi:putative inactive leucine-rich repeat receptor kinase IMK2 [Chlorella sorokiniana]|uniref:Inactive leucine-rich repeat receptor kinase IMK2 n=1 Tax=Chlorella sorokiniana TaxID=3076 RepID=A0A2P6TVP9_CHLSO|nr:putative inactive leucine-rich repeat receptor kinase IMK2 [Chlorella sorokiniana]|eukprot:PRW58131.1 putative inactive leucine-rich repeat receptor kinase IMK2 [Chlorella sorokiniana]